MSKRDYWLHEVEQGDIVLLASYTNPVLHTRHILVACTQTEHPAIHGWQNWEF